MSETGQHLITNTVCAEEILFSVLMPLGDSEQTFDSFINNMMSEAEGSYLILTSL